MTLHGAILLGAPRSNRTSGQDSLRGITVRLDDRAIAFSLRPNCHDHDRVGDDPDLAGAAGSYRFATEQLPGTAGGLATSRTGALVQCREG